MHVPPIALERSLTRSHSSPGFRHLRRSAQLPETLGNAEVNNGGPSDAENNLEPIGQRRNSETAAEDERPVLTADIKVRNELSVSGQMACRSPSGLKPIWGIPAYPLSEF